MRQIKFRGKMLDGGRWIYGSLLTWPDGETYILYDKDFATTGTMSKDPVRPETVGQFTGLTDDHGKEIYEGDVIRLFGVFRTPCVVVKFIRDGFFSERPNGNLCPLGKELMIGGPNNIIGNIHDNPELIEE